MHAVGLRRGDEKCFGAVPHPGVNIQGEGGSRNGILW